MTTTQVRWDLPPNSERQDRHDLVSPSYSLRRARLSRPRDRMSSERRRAMDGPSARAVGQAGEPKAPDVSRANKWGRRPLVTLGLSKVTRPSPKGGRNPVEANGLASCTAKPCHHATAPAANAIPRNGRLRLTANRPYDCTAQPCLLATGTESGWTPGCHRQRGMAAPIGPKTPPSP